MSNAAIFFHPDAFDTQARLMGRQSAGESFLRGFIRHAQVERFHLWNWTANTPEVGEALVRRIEPVAKPISWIGRRDFAGLSEPGCLFVSSPSNAQEAWNRRLVGPSRYSICGLTHTTASQGAMDALVNMLLAPVEPWDALICTSRAVTASVQAQLDLAIDYLRERLGPVTRPPLTLATIPLGVNVGDFEPDPKHRKAWRARLGVPDDALVALYVGRLSAHGKMNPVPMAMALERAAQRTTRPIHWVQVGWANNEHLHASFTSNAHRYAPSVTAHVLDGRRADVRFAIWSAADVFFSLSDNIQETFGLTPVEAMAAGLPSVISDWDGYRDTVRHQVDGFRVPTVTPRPGMGGDLAVAHANGWESYDHYMGFASQFAAVDIEAAAQALSALFDSEDLRRRMGAAARERARTVFDWSVIIPQYQALWSELAGIRSAAPARPRGGLNPWRPDPFTLFAGYPTQTLEAATVIAAAPGADAAAVAAILADPTASYAGSVLPRADELAAMLETLARRGPLTAADLIAGMPAARRGLCERALLFMAKFGLVTLSPLMQIPSG